MIALTFDTETINVRDLSCFDIGMVARDLEKGEIIDSLQMFPKEVVENKELLEKAYFYKKNREVYEDVESTPMEEVRLKFNNFIKDNNVKIISAFNIGFDLRVINYNFQKFANKKSNTTIIGLSKKMIVIDIPLLFGVHSLFDTDDYRNYCFLGNRVTKAGRAKSTAEAIASYIKRDQDLKEEHTGLEDSILESEIIQYVKDNSDEEEFDLLLKEASILTRKNKKLFQTPGIRL